MREFQPEDHHTAAAFYRAITDSTAKAVLDYLIDHPEERINGATLVRALGLPEHRAVARATYARGQTAAAQCRKRPWTEAQQGYLMPAPIAELFRKARG